MSDQLEEMMCRRDQALRDLLDLEAQVEAGELSPDVAADLRRRYEAEAASAIAALTSAPRLPAARKDDSEQPSATDARPHRPGARRAWYALVLAAAVAAVVMVPQYIVDRPSGGFVTGNEVRQQPAGTQTPESSTMASPSRDLASVSDAELEKVVEANPDIIGMRLALAARYADKGRYDLAVVHYTTALEQDPDNAEAQAHLGWILLQLDRPREAARQVDRALGNNPKLLDALWFQANIRLYGLRDAEGAVETLDTMRARQDLTPQVRRQVEQLRSTALNRLGDDQ